jgi:transposase
MAAEKIAVTSFERRKPARRPLPEHLPRPHCYLVPAICPCCGDRRLRKIGEDVTETLELVPRQWKVIQHVREKLVCRACEAIPQPPAPSHPIARGRAGPKLLAHVLFAKYGLHLTTRRWGTSVSRAWISCGSQVAVTVPKIHWSLRSSRYFGFVLPKWTAPAVQFGYYITSNSIDLSSDEPTIVSKLLVHFGMIIELWGPGYQEWRRTVMLSVFGCAANQFLRARAPLSVLSVGFDFACRGHSSSTGRSLDSPSTTSLDAASR